MAHRKKRTMLLAVTGGSILVVVLLSVFLKSNYTWRLLDQCIINALIAIGLNLICGYSGQMHFGPTAMTAIGAYTAAIISTKLGGSMWIGLLAAVVMNVLVGLLLGYPCMKIKGIYLGLTTMAFAEMIRILANNVIPLTGGPTGINGIPGMDIFSLRIKEPREFFYLLLVISGVMTWMAWQLTRSKWGRLFKAIATEEQAVQTCGINIFRVKVCAFIFSSVYMGVGGALYASLMAYITPSGFTAEVGYKYLMMILVGGYGTISGSILGSFLITLLPEALRVIENYYLLVFYIVVFLMAVLRPHGLVDLLRRATGWIHSKVSKRKEAI